MLRYHDHILVIALLACVSGCGDEEPSGSPAESAVLKQEMIDATLELMRAEKPEADSEGLRGQVQQLVEAGIIEIRKHDPEFLIVSAETEKKLQSGNPVPDATERIADAERSFVESGAEPPELVKVMLAQHEAGTLSHRRTELLAQLIVGAVREHEALLTK